MVIASPALAAHTPPAGLPALDPFDTPWCRAAAFAGLAPWMYDVDLDRLFWSDALHARVGYPALPSTPTVRWWATQVHPDDIAASIRVYDDVGAGVSDEWVMQYRLRHADGSWLRVTDAGIATRHADGRVHRLYGFVALP
jgi:PAS domain-containing protein